MRRGADLAIIVGSLAVVATLILVPLSLWLTVTGPDVPDNALLNRVLFRLSPATFGPVGLFIATRRRGNPVAWILIALGFAVAASAVAGDVASAASGPTVALLALANTVGYILLVALACTLVRSTRTDISRLRVATHRRAIAVWFGLQVS